MENYKDNWSKRNDSQRDDERRESNYFNRDGAADNRHQPRPRFNNSTHGAPQYAKVEQRNGDRRENNNRSRFSSYSGKDVDGNRFDNNNEGNSRYADTRDRGYQSRPRFNNSGERSNYRPEENNYQRNNNYSAFNSESRQEGSYRGRNNYRSEDSSQGGYRSSGSYNNDRRSGGASTQGGYSGGNNRQGYNNNRPYGSNDNSRGAYNSNDKYSKKKQIEYRDSFIDPNAPVRLNKYLANAGVCSRREADEFILAGVVTVNGKVVTELGTKIQASDDVKFHDEGVSLEKKVYILLNKPKDCVTTVDDPQERKTVLDCLRGACKERIYPVGRLDRNTTGVLLLTNDGDMASKLTHPKFKKKKIYHVYCDKNVSMPDMEQLVNGIELEDGTINADEVTYVADNDRSQIGIEIHSGKNRIVRRMMEHLGYNVIKLDRVLFAGLTKKNLRRGDWRYLTEKEVSMLRMGAHE